MTTRLFPLLVSTALAGAACFPYRDSGTGTLQLAPGGVGAVGFPLTVTVRHVDPQWETCSVSWSCSGTAATTLTLDGVSCDPADCEAGEASSGQNGVLTVPVTSHRAGALTLHVTTHAAGGGQTYSADVELDFREPSGLTLTPWTPGVFVGGYAVLPGATGAMNLAAVSSDGTTLAVPGESFQAQVEGSAVVPQLEAETAELRLTAAAPGDATLTVSLGALTRSERLRVVSPEGVVGFEVRPLNDGNADLASPDALGPALSSLTVDGSLHSDIVVLHLNDGTRALGGAPRLRLDPPELGAVRVQVPSDGDATAIADAAFGVQAAGSGPDHGSLSLELGTSTDLLPVVVIRSP